MTAATTMPSQAASESPFGHVVRHMTKMMDQMQKGYFNFCPGETWSPSVNLYENDTAYLVCVDLCGVDKEKIDLVVVDNQLRLRGHRAVPVVPGGQERPKMRVHLMEIDYGPFNREVDLPNDVNHERISAQYLNGMLWIELPKR